MYRVIEVAEVLGVSKVTIYKKIEQLKPEIIAHLKTEEGITYVSDFGVNLIKKSIKRKKTRRPRDKALLKVVDLNCELTNNKAELEEIRQKLEESNLEYIKELQINSRHLDTIISGKTMELKSIEQTNRDLSLALEQANKLLLQLENDK